MELKEYAVCCYNCQRKENLVMVSHRKADKIAGWLFACCDCFYDLKDNDLEITTAVRDHHDTSSFLFFRECLKVLGYQGGTFHQVLTVLSYAKKIAGQVHNKDREGLPKTLRKLAKIVN